MIAAGVPQPAVILAAAALAGVMVGPLFTTVVGIGVRYRPSASGMIAGFMLAMGGVGFAGLSLLTGAVADTLSVRAAVALLPAFLAIALVLLMAARRIHAAELRS